MKLGHGNDTFDLGDTARPSPLTELPHRLDCDGRDRLLLVRPLFGEGRRAVVADIEPLLMATCCEYGLTAATYGALLKLLPDGIAPYVVGWKSEQVTEICQLGEILEAGCVNAVSKELATSWCAERKAEIMEGWEA